MRVHRSSNGLSVRPLDLRAEPARTRLQQIRDDEETINSGMARVLYEAWAGTLSRRQTKNDHTVKIAALLNRGAITVSTAAEERYASRQTSSSPSTSRYPRDARRVGTLRVPALHSAPRSPRTTHANLRTFAAIQRTIRANPAN